jgi:hypothetical protein
MCHHDVATVWGDVSSLNYTFDMFSRFTIYGALAVTMRDVTIYLISYIFRIIDYYICQNIFNRIYILYIVDVSGDNLLLKTIILYI